MKTSHCEDCAHKLWSPKYAATPQNLQCTKGHRPRFYLPATSLDTNWGWKRRCTEFTMSKYVRTLKPTASLPK